MHWERHTAHITISYMPGTARLSLLQRTVRLCVCVPQTLELQRCGFAPSPLLLMELAGMPNLETLELDSLQQLRTGDGAQHVMGLCERLPVLERVVLRDYGYDPPYGQRDMQEGKIALQALFRERGREGVVLDVLMWPPPADVPPAAAAGLPAEVAPAAAPAQAQAEAEAPVEPPAAAG